MKRFLFMLVCATAQAQDASYLEYKLVTEGRLIELSQLYELQEQVKKAQQPHEESDIEYLTRSLRESYEARARSEQR
jgi:hypothetical protein